MEYKGFCVLMMFVAVAISYGSAFPRDIGVIKTDHVRRIEDESLTELPKDLVITNDNKDITTDPAKHFMSPYVPVSCTHEEATEDEVCQEHCLPKGYSYGLCIGYKCSCA